jgi:membrane-bound serine protease (ClpP class)
LVRQPVGIGRLVVAAGLASMLLAVVVGATPGGTARAVSPSPSTTGPASPAATESGSPTATATATASPAATSTPGPATTAAPSVTPGTVGDPTAPVYVLTATGVVDNIMAGYIEESVKRAADDGSPAIIVMLNTPGGSIDSTQRIDTALLKAPLPTIVYVAPSGGRAASAGTFITMSAALAYMAPGTNIGAASPVGSGGQDLTGTEGEKVKSDAMANIHSIATARGHNADWAVSTVEKAVSTSATEAVSLGAVNGIAVSVEDVQRKADGQVVDVNNAPVTVTIADAPLVDLDMNPFQSFLHLLSDPNIAFILLTIGFYGLLFELIHPNFVTGIIGSIALILAFIGAGSLPVNIAGVLLIGLAVVLFLLEITVTSHGLLAIGGLICFVLGAFALYTAPGSPTAPDVSVASPLILIMAALTAAYVALILFVVVRTRRRTQLYAGAYGAGGSHIVPAGSGAVVKTTLAPVGVVYAAGEEWTARSATGVEIPPGQPVRVVGQDGITLIVASATGFGPPAVPPGQEARP